MLSSVIMITITKIFLTCLARISVAFIVAYLIVGDFYTALAIGLIEPFIHSLFLIAREWLSGAAFSGGELVKCNISKL
jgi:uncharacterized membrane protein